MCLSGFGRELVGLNQHFFKNLLYVGQGTQAVAFEGELRNVRDLCEMLCKLCHKL